MYRDVNQQLPNSCNNSVIWQLTQPIALLDAAVCLGKCTGEIVPK